MLLTTLSFFHVAAALLCRDQRNTIFDRDAVPGVMQLRRYGISLCSPSSWSPRWTSCSGSSAPPR